MIHAIVVRQIAGTAVPQIVQNDLITSLLLILTTLLWKEGQCQRTLLILSKTSSIRLSDLMLMCKVTEWLPYFYENPRHI